jgi:membrane-bound lytic murein transglycosylase D
MLHYVDSTHRTKTFLLALLVAAGMFLYSGCSRSISSAKPSEETPRADERTKQVTQSGGDTSGLPLAYTSEHLQSVQQNDSASAVKAQLQDTAARAIDGSATTPLPTTFVEQANGGIQPSERRNSLLSKEDILLYYGQVNDEDSASAVDDAVWRQFDLAGEYHQMGVIANREASWEEAQYYFEKALKILANLDIEEDSVLTPESERYNGLLNDVISDYRMTLRSLGQLQEDVTPSVMLERFAEVEDRLNKDSLQVYGAEPAQIVYDLPIKMNERVKSSIIYFQTVAKEAFTKYLTRSKKYQPLFREVLAKYGLPQDLIYLSLVESGYNPKAYSWARASGLWQFISSTGRLYGLNRDWWVDERRDPVKSTDAACRFLKDLYTQFGDWELAMAAYNGGPGRIDRTIRSQGTVDFWKMRLKRQTMDYVPLIYAATIIAKDPERYGFTEVNYEPGLVWDEVIIDRCLDLKVVASAIGCSVADIEALNPELLRSHTPPNYKEYCLKIPAGTKQGFLAAYENMASPKESSWVRHEIRQGETIGTISARYGVSQYAILEANNMSPKSRIFAGKTLIVPVPLDRSGAVAWGNAETQKYEAEGSVYTVRGGDTMWDIARAFGTSVEALRRVNYIERGTRIYVGQRLKLPSDSRNLEKKNTPSGGGSTSSYAAADSEPAGEETADANQAATAIGQSRTYTVRSGDTVWDIARKFGTTTTALRTLNGLSRTSRIQPGQVLVVSKTEDENIVIHTVRQGETLSVIAKQYRTTIARILAANNLDDPDNIPVGQALRIYVRQ